MKWAAARCSAPVVAAAVVLSPDRPVRGLNDSKLLAPERREVLAVRIRERAERWAIAAVDAATIDRINIYQASRLAMRLAVQPAQPGPRFPVDDAMPIRASPAQQPLIKGDARCHAIAAASILAKVYRDACMRVWDGVFPQYGLAAHTRLCDAGALPGHPGVRHHTAAPPELRASAGALPVPRRLRSPDGSVRHGGRRMMPTEPGADLAGPMPAPAPVYRWYHKNVRGGVSSPSAWKSDFPADLSLDRVLGGQLLRRFVPEWHRYWDNMYVRGAVSGLAW